MRLRARLVLAAVLAALPAAGLAGFLRYQLEWREAEARLVQFAEVELYGRGVLQHILRDPRHFPRRPGPRGQSTAPDGVILSGMPPDVLPEGADRRPGGQARRGPRAPAIPPRGLFAYREDFTSANPASPPFPVELRRELGAGASSASVVLEGERPQLAVGWRTREEDGPATWILITSAQVPTFLTWPIAASFLLAAGIVVAALLLAMGPVVARARRLAVAVEGLAGDPGRAIPIEGGDELTDVARAFETAHQETSEARREAEQREESLRGFVENTAHDLGTPLTVLQARLARLAQQAPGEDADAAIQEAQYVSSLLGNLSAVSRLEDGAAPLRRDPVDLPSLIERVVARHGFLASERGVDLQHALPGSPVLALGEVTLLEQALGNLVHNGLRHGRQGGNVTVHLKEAGAGAFELRVLDDGPGLSAEQLARLGQRRWRSEEARQRRPEGRGLGAAIARDVFERHGWSLNFSSGEGAGLTATIEGPVANGPGPA